MRRPASSRSLYFFLLFNAASYLHGSDENLIPPPPVLEAANEEVVLSPDVVERQPEPGEAEYWEALIAFLNPAASSQEAAREKLRQAASFEFTPAQNLLGISYLSGSYGFEQNPRKAVNWFELAVKGGDRFAMVNLAGCYLDRVGVFRKNESLAQELLERALAEEGNWYPDLEPPPAYFEAVSEQPRPPDVYLTSMQERSEALANLRLGQIHFAREHHALAHPYFVRAANVGENGRGGLHPAAIQAALNFAFGQGVERDMDAARKMLNHSKTLLRERALEYAAGLIDLQSIDRFAVRATRQEAEEASEQLGVALQMNIAQTFGNRSSPDFDADQAVLWFELAAESGQPWAMVQLGELYNDATLSVYDPEKAFKWYAHGYENNRHILLIANYAIALYHGVGTEPDRQRADDIFFEHKANDIVCHIGTLGYCPEQPLTYQQYQDLIKQWATGYGDIHAQYLYGRAFYYGWGVPGSNREAFRWFTRAAEAEHPEALYFLGEIFLHGHGQRQDFAKANAYFQQAADLGSVPATARLAFNVMNGIGIAQNLDKGRDLYLRLLAREPEHTIALNNLGVYYERRLTALTRKDSDSDESQKEELRAEMLAAYQAAAQKEDGLANRNLGVLYLQGKLVEPDYRQALRYLSAAADRGEPRAYLDLAKIYNEGLGIGRNVDEAAHYFRLAGLHDPNQQNRRVALQQLCDYYLSGASGSSDFSRAIEWMDLLIKNGGTAIMGPYGDTLLKLGHYAEARDIFRSMSRHANSQLRGYGFARLSKIYDEGLGIRPDPRLAERYRKNALDLRFGDALVEAALQHQAEGDEAQTVRMLRDARANGSGQAAFLLAQRHAEGRGVEQDSARAVSLYREAAKTHYPPALLNLAEMTLHNAEGAPSLEEAIDLARRAETLGNAEATAVREALETRYREERSRGGSGSGEGLT